ncbi:DUF1501 domain-containing protein [Flavobacteriaceae bacterium]|jgi:uncharacterized protein (DUF1501 family)|nr:DUF1501 domain-containing protein [Flavobacteriaceae bacterium]
MKRRNFIKLTSTASAISLLPSQVTASLNIAKSFLDCTISNRKLVLINLAGGNDGLNTIIPINYYDIYSNLRPSIKVPSSGINSYINLDETLDENQQIGLHPSLTGIKNLYDNDLLRIIQSVGYPSQNKSHFASTDIYSTANDGNSWNNGNNSGWIGRFMESYYADLIQNSYPLGVEIGSKSNSLGFHGESEHGLSVNINGQDPSGFYSLISGMAGEPPNNIPISDYGHELEYIIQTDALSNMYSEAISNSFNNGQNAVSYPDTDISNQLKTVARLISGGLESKVYMVKLSGFDTHFGQNQAENDILGDHNNLLTKLSSAVAAFMNDLSAMNLKNDVVGLTYSEFGRKAAENGSLGTDHGETAPMFVFGAPVKGGVSGLNPDLNEANENNGYQIQTVQFDYRDTLGTLLQDYLGADNLALDATFFNNTLNQSFSETKIDDLIKSEFSVATNCYSNSLTNNNDRKKIFYIINPVYNDLIIKSKNQEYSSFKYELYDLNSKLVSKGNSRINESISISHLINGIYILNILTNEKSEAHRIIKR